MPAYGRVGTRAFTLKSAALPRSGQRRAGKKEGVLGVLCPQEFLPARRFWRSSCRAAGAAGTKPDARAGREGKGLGERNSRPALAFAAAEFFTP